MNIQKITDKFSKLRVVIIGDIMLDKYIYGSSDRLSPEAPVPVVKVEKETYDLGGAANVAKNINSLGGQAFLFGYIGGDNAGKILIKMLEEKNIQYKLFPILNETTQKIRVIGNYQQQILRIDRGCYLNVSGKIEKELVQGIFEKKPDIIIISDYGNGGFTKNLISEIKKSFKNNEDIRILVDPKPKNKDNYFGAYLITPNLKEAKEMTNLCETGEIGRNLQRELNMNVLLTMGKEGMVLFEKEKVVDIPTRAKEIYDVSGAGDTVIATMALGLASQLSLEESAFLANHAAGIVVGRTGTSSVSKNDLKQVIESEYIKIKNLDELTIIRQDYLRKGKKIIWTNGCFDLLHSGHVNYLKKAKKLGDYLFVGLNNDDSVRKLKGKNRPIQSEHHRAEVLSSLECVDYVYVFSELSVEKSLMKLKPDVYVKGGDYDLSKIDQKERNVIEGYGGEIVFIPIEEEISTTKIIEKIRNNPD